MSALGSLVVKIALDHAQYTQGLDRSSQEALKFAQNSQRSFDQAEQSAKEFFGNVATGAVGVVTSIIGIDAAISRTRQNIDVLASLNDIAQETGSSVEDLSRIQKTAKNFGDDFGAIEQSISRLAKGLGTFDDESNQALRALDAIGVSARDSNGQLRTSAEVYIDAAKSLQQYKDGAEKTAVANALFGKSGAEMLPVLDNLARGIDDVTGASAGSAAQADEFNDALSRAGAAIDGLFGQLAQNLLPTLLSITSAFGQTTSSMSVMSVVSDGVIVLLKGLAISGYSVFTVFESVGRTFGALAAMSTALVRGDFAGISAISQAFEADNIKAGAEFKQFVDTVLNGDQKLAAAATDGGMKKTIDFALNMPAAQKEATQSTRQAIDASQSFMDKLQQEADQLGKTGAEIRKMQAAKLGLSAAADPLIDQIESETAAAKLLEAQLSKVKSITQANMTADERFSQTIAELNDLMALPDSGLSPETYSRAVQKAQSELESSMNATKDAGRSAADEWDSIWRTSENTARMAFTAFAAHGTSAMESIGQSIKTAIIDTLYQLTVRKWIVNIGASIGGIGGTGIGPAAGGSSFGIGDIVGAGANLFSAFGKGAGSLLGRGASALGFSSFGAGASGAATSGVFGAGGLNFLGGAGTALGTGAEFGVTAGLGASMAAIAGPLIAVDIAGRLFGGNKTLGGAEMIPVIGGFLAGLFGHGPLKFRQQSLQGDVSSGGFDGDITNVFRAKGGLLVGNKHKSVNEQLSDDQQKTFDAAIKGFYTSAYGFAENLGLSTGLVDTFTQTIQVKSEKGKQLTEEAVTQMLAGIGDSLAKNVLPGIDDLRKVGESSFETFTRLNTEFNALTSGAENLGASVSYAKDLVKGMSFEARTAFIDMSGGMEALASKTSFFAQNFLTDEERLAPTITRLHDGLKVLGLSADITKDQFKSLVQDVNLSNETRNKLLDLAPAFIAVSQATEAVTASTVAALQLLAADPFSQHRSAMDQQFSSSIQDITQSISQLEGIADQLRGTVNSINPLSVADARRIISSGNPNDPNLQAALSTLSGMGTGSFSNVLDFQRAKALNVASIGSLQGSIDSSISGKYASIDKLKLDAVVHNDILNSIARDMANKLPRYASGSSYIAKTGPAILHQGERVINPQQNQDLVDGIKMLVKRIEELTESAETQRRMLREAMVETDDGLALRQPAAA